MYVCNMSVCNATQWNVLFCHVCTYVVNLIHMCIYLYIFTVSVMLCVYVTYMNVYELYHWSPVDSTSASISTCWLLEDFFLLSSWHLTGSVC